MSHDDITILTPILLMALGALIVTRLTFRNAGPALGAIITPPVFAVIGGLVGISAGMIWLSDSEGRVTIDKGILVLLCGSAAGAVIGVGARVVYCKLRRGKTVAIVLVVMLLGACIGAPIGWLVVDISTKGAHDGRICLSGMARGVAIGSAIGLLLGLPEVLFRRGGVT
jgi:hypothetical protein